MDLGERGKGAKNGLVSCRGVVCVWWANRYFFFYLIVFIFVDGFHQHFAGHDIDNKETVVLYVVQHFVGQQYMNSGRPIYIHRQFRWITCVYRNVTLK